MSILQKPPPKLNPEPPCCSSEPRPCLVCVDADGIAEFRPHPSERRGPGEPIPARLTADDLESIVRYGHTGETAGPGRIEVPLTPKQLEDLADQMELAYIARSGRNDAPGYQIGFVLSRYRSLHRLYQETLDRLEATRMEFWPDETPELPESEYYDPAEELASTGS